ncbi:MAG: hypothetical protein MMC33_008850 [Icmadophila ericetorum]|nr:hypothetical protein [Icmadophila ericetorum]
MTASQNFASPPPSTSFTKISFPKPHVLLVVLSRPKSLNCINSAGHRELDEIWKWLDNEPSMRVGIVTGEGRAFCAGADLKELSEWNTNNATGRSRGFLPSGFGALSTRTGKKPIIAAVNGICFGGGMEIAINLDIVLASPQATFGLPEVKRGVVAVAGALPRLVRTVGKQRAMEMALLGRAYSAEEMLAWGLVNKVVPADSLIEEAVQWATEIASNSPDSVIVSREGVKIGWESLSAQAGTEMLAQTWFSRINQGENMKEGVRAFVEKRAPRWRDSKL